MLSFATGHELMLLWLCGSRTLNTKLSARRVVQEFEVELRHPLKSAIFPPILASLPFVERVVIKQTGDAAKKNEPDSAPYNRLLAGVKSLTLEAPNCLVFFFDTQRMVAKPRQDLHYDHNQEEGQGSGHSEELQGDSSWIHLTEVTLCNTPQSGDYNELMAIPLARYCPQVRLFKCTSVRSWLPLSFEVDAFPRTLTDLSLSADHLELHFGLYSPEGFDLNSSLWPPGLTSLRLQTSESFGRSLWSHRLPRSLTSLHIFELGGNDVPPRERGLPWDKFLPVKPLTVLSLDLAIPSIKTSGLLTFLHQQYQTHLKTLVAHNPNGSVPPYPLTTLKWECSIQHPTPSSFSEMAPLLPPSITHLHIRDAKVESVEEALLLPRNLKHFTGHQKINPMLVPLLPPGLEFLSIADDNSERQEAPPMDLFGLQECRRLEIYGGSGFISRLPPNLTSLNMLSSKPMELSFIKLLPAGLTHFMTSMPINAAGVEEFSLFQLLPRGLTNLTLQGTIGSPPLKSTDLPRGLTHLVLPSFAPDRDWYEGLPAGLLSLAMLNAHDFALLSPLPCTQLRSFNITISNHGALSQPLSQSVPRLPPSLRKFSMAVGDSSVSRPSVFSQNYKGEPLLLITDITAFPRNLSSLSLPVDSYPSLVTRGSSGRELFIPPGTLPYLTKIHLSYRLVKVIRHPTGQIAPL